MIKIKQFASYNERRYSTPWGAKVALENGELKYAFSGLYSGACGCAGAIMMDVSEGDIVAIGQKDFRGKQTVIEFAIIAGGHPNFIPKAEAVEILNNNA